MSPTPVTEDARQRFAAFLDRSGWQGAEIAPLAGDASNRRYYRVHRDGMGAVLMDAPAARGEDVRPFIDMTQWLRGADLSAPEILASDLQAGMLLLEDLGDDLYARWLARRPDDEEALYGAAVDLLAGLAAVPPPPGLGAYDAAVLIGESLLAVEWWLPLAGEPVTASLRDEAIALFGRHLRPPESTGTLTVLRDYHAENLLWLPNRAGYAQVGLLDYQDALAGAPAYDLVSLLEDARRDTSDELRAAMISRYLARRDDLDKSAFLDSYARLGAQRNLKILGIFARLARRDGKPAYLDLIPRVWAHLMRDLRAPALAPLAEWVRRHVPLPEPAVLDAARARARARSGEAS